jgi:metal-responsive CopG/Arc/MetJ family transcriptional regulator
MAKSAVKLAISLPPEDFREMESLRRKLKTTRSAVVRQALRTYFQARQQQAMVAQYVEGYRRFPERPEELAGLAQAQLAAMAAEEPK